MIFLNVVDVKISIPIVLTIVILLRRLLIGVMDKWYGKYIHYFDKLAEEAFWSVMKQNHSWDSLNLQIKMALE